MALLSNNVEVVVKTTGDTSGIDKTKTSLENLGSSTTSVQGKVSTFGDTFKAIFASEVVTKAIEGLDELAHKVIDFGVDSVKSYMDSENQIAQTNAVLKSTGGIAGVTAEQVDALSKSWESQTTYSDEAVRSAENMLLTFTNISEKTFPGATQAVLDMATAMGSDLSSTAIQVGKALQDPVLGATALQRVGVRLTQTQKDLIQSMVDSGNAAGAQAVIIKELTNEFGGSAAAAGGTFAGSLAKLANQFDDFKELVGQTIVEAMKPYLDNLNKWIESMGGVDGVFDKVKKKISDFANTVIDLYNKLAKYLKPAFDSLFTAINTQLIPTLARLWNTFSPLIPIIGQTLVGAFRVLVQVIAFVVSGSSQLIPLLIGVGAAMAAMRVLSLVQDLYAFAAAGGIATTATRVFAGALALLNMNPIILAVSALVGLFVALSLTQNQNAGASDSLSGAIARQKSAQDALTQANKDAKNAEDSLSGAKLNAQGASLRLEQAQRDATQAVKDFGPNSLEARTALYNVQVATQGVADANKDVQDKATKAAAAQQQVIDKKEALVKANNDVASSANNAATSYKSFAAEVDAASAAMKRGDQAAAASALLSIPGQKALPVMGVQKRATGGPVSGGQTYAVGDNPDGSWNETTELFVPDRPGKIMNQAQLAAQNGGGSGGGSVHIYGDISLGDDSAVAAFFKQIDRNSELARKGLTTVKAAS